MEVSRRAERRKEVGAPEVKYLKHHLSFYFLDLRRSQSTDWIAAWAAASRAIGSL
jgi:hypothetical protein